MPNHDGTGPAKGCCNEGEHKENGCGCANKQQHQGEEGKCCHDGEKHRHHGLHQVQEGGCCCKTEEK